MRSPVSPALYDQFARGWRGYVLIALIALTSSLFGAARIPVMEGDEARFAQATRQMIESGDYVSIRLQDEARNKKPVGIHWLQATAVQAAEPFTHRLNAIWPYRLPSALGIVLAAMATLWGGVVLVGQRQAFFGAALFAAGVSVGFEGMTAKTDAVLIGFTALALAALARMRMQAPSSREEGVGGGVPLGVSSTPAPDHASISNGGASPHPRPPPLKGRGFALIFWLALACGIMIKGPITPLVAALTLAALALWERRARWMAPLLRWPGPLLAAAIIAPWTVAISQATDGRFFSDMFFGDLAPKLVSGQEEHFALPGYHLFLLPFLIFPATYALPAAARLSWDAIRAPRNDDEHRGLRFLLAWAVPIFVFFELAPTKLAHYALPAYPAIALLCGAGLMAMTGKRWRTAHPAGVVLFAVAGAAIVALMGAAATFMPGDFTADLRRAISTALIGLGVVALAFTALIMLRRPAVRAAALVACALALSFSFRERLLPEARALNVSPEVVAALTRARLMPRDDQPLWVVGYREPSLVFLTRSDIRLATPQEAAARAQVGDALVVEGRALQEVSADLALRALTFMPAEPPVRGLSLGRGERVALFVGTLRPLSDEPAVGPPRNP